MSLLVSVMILIINVSAWLIEWHLVVGYNSFRHESLFYISFGAFMATTFIQFLMECFEDNGNFDEQREQDRLGMIVGVGSTILLALSILASLPIINANTAPVLRSRFHWAALAAFLWIVFGVLWITWLETNNNAHRAATMVYARRIKTAALTHALGWAGTSAIMLIGAIRK